MKRSYPKYFSFCNMKEKISNGSLVCCQWSVSPSKRHMPWKKKVPIAVVAPAAVAAALPGTWQKRAVEHCTFQQIKLMIPADLFSTFLCCKNYYNTAKSNHVVLITSRQFKQNISFAFTENGIFLLESLIIDWNFITSKSPVSGGIEFSPTNRILHVGFFCITSFRRSPGKFAFLPVTHLSKFKTANSNLGVITWNGFCFHFCVTRNHVGFSQCAVASHCLRWVLS